MKPFEGFSPACDQPQRRGLSRGEVITYKFLSQLDNHWFEHVFIAADGTEFAMSPGDRTITNAIDEYLELV
jgi:hypothetical protein